MPSDLTEARAFNGLSHAQAERLALLAEECGEVIQVIGKILRHGYESAHPDGGPANRELLENELGVLRASYRLMIRETDFSEANMARAFTSKTARMGRYLHHQNGIEAARPLQGQQP